MQIRCIFICCSEQMMCLSIETCICIYACGTEKRDSTNPSLEFGTSGGLGRRMMGKL